MKVLSDGSVPTGSGPDCSYNFVLHNGGSGGWSKWSLLKRQLFQVRGKSTVSFLSLPGGVACGLSQWVSAHGCGRNLALVLSSESGSSWRSGFLPSIWESGTDKLLSRTERNVLSFPWRVALSSGLTNMTECHCPWPLSLLSRWSRWTGQHPPARWGRNLIQPWSNRFKEENMEFIGIFRG